jgi:hypothetical protein
MRHIDAQNLLQLIGLTGDTPRQRERLAGPPEPGKVTVNGLRDQALLQVGIRAAPVRFSCP